MTSSIEWTDDSFNPFQATRQLADGSQRLGWHCEKTSPGCRLCYAEQRNMSQRCNYGTGLHYQPRARPHLTPVLNPGFRRWPQARKRRTVFVWSMTDPFLDFWPEAWVDEVLLTMKAAPQLFFFVLTKYPARMRQTVERLGKRLIASNIMWMTSMENQATLAARLPELQALPAWCHTGVSFEPLLGQLDFRGIDTGRLPDWFICGGQSGRRGNPIPLHLAWVNGLQVYAQEQGIPFFFKQWGASIPAEEALTGAYTGTLDTAHVDVNQYLFMDINGNVRHNLRDVPDQETVQICNRVRSLHNYHWLSGELYAEFPQCVQSYRRGNQ